MAESAGVRLFRINAIAGEDLTRPAVKGSSNGLIKGTSGENGINTGTAGFALFFRRAGCVPPPLRRVVLALSVTLASIIPGYLVLGLPGLALPAIVVAVMYGVITRKAWRRAERFEQDYTAFLLSLSSSIRVGLDPLVAFTRCGELFPAESVLAAEIRTTAVQIESGISEDEAYLRFAETIHHPDIGLLRTALILSRKHGSSLGACLHRLARVTRQRQSFRRKVRGAVAMQRLSAFGIAGCTVIVGMIQVSSNPHAIAQAWDHPVGALALGGGLSLVGLGLIWMLHMSRRRL